MLKYNFRRTAVRELLRKSSFRACPRSDSISATASLVNSVSAPIVLGNSAGTGMINTNGYSMTISGPISGAGTLNKVGAGILALTGTDTYTGPTTVSGGTLALPSANASTSFTANNGGTLLLSGANATLGSGSIRAMAGGTVQYANATINGGFLRGPGTHVTLPGTSNYFSGATTYVTTIFLQNGSDTFSNFSNGGQVTNNGPLIWDGGENNLGGNLTVNSSVSTNDFTNAGAITINSGGVLILRAV